MSYRDDLDKLDLDGLEAEADERIQEFREEVERRREETTDPEEIAALGEKLGEAEALHEESMEMIEDQRRRQDIADLIREIDESDIERPDLWREIDELDESEEEIEEILNMAGATLEDDGPDSPSIR